MMNFLRLVLFFALAGALAWVFHNFQSPVLLAYGGWQISPPLPIFVLLAAAVLAGCYIALRALGLVWFLPKRWKRWRGQAAREKESAAHRRLMRAMALDSPAEVKKILSELSGASRHPATLVLLANLSDRAAAQKLWSEAAKGGDEELAGLARAALAFSQDRHTEAHAALAAKNADKIQSRARLRLLAQTARRLGNWRAAAEAARRLRALSAPQGNHENEKDGALDDVADIVRRHHRACHSAAELRTFWSEALNNDERGNPLLAAAHAARLNELGEGAAAAQTLARALKTSPQHPALLEAAASIGDEEFRKKTLMRGEAASPQTPDLLRALAKLASALQLWGKAEKFYETANTHELDQRNFQGLAAVAQARGASAEEINAIMKRAAQVGGGVKS